MKRIENLRTLEPLYKMDDHGAVEELSIFIRRYPSDGRKKLTCVLERRVFDRTLDRKVFVSQTYTEMETVPIGKAHRDDLPTAVQKMRDACLSVARTDGYEPEPPTWLRQHLWDLEVQRDIHG